MKKIIYAIGVTALAITSMLTSCTKDFEKLNTDPNATQNTLPAQLLAPALVNSVSANLTRNRNFNNELMQVTVDMSDAEGKVFRYDYRSTWSDYTYTQWYLQINDFKLMYKAATDPLTVNKSYQGISLICQSWLYSLLTDTYGDVPYFHAMEGKDSANFRPAFDRQKDIYLDLFKQLDSANNLLKANEAIATGSDPVFNGDVSKWRKFGNSLYLRLLLRISGKSEVADQVIAKIKDIVDVNATNYPIMTSNADAAILRWTGVGPLTSPLLNIREQDFRTPAICSFFIDNLAAWNDPRIDIPTYGSGGYNRWGIIPYRGMFKGVESGYTPGQGVVKLTYFNSWTATSTGPSLMNEQMTGMILNYSELCFTLAEASLKGWLKTPASTYYRNGVYNGINQWLPKFTEDSVNNYLTASDMSWIEGESQDQKMERIHLQKYYGMFLTDFQQWFEYRRTGHPKLPKGQGLRNGGVMPARMTYPIFIQSTNTGNYRDVIAAQGPDQISTQVWWQKP
ncbi:SusD/RagB family nutrient-binding outer membrane lipoprotein [Chitinophaga sp. sic0106]|uniref:SusD/RagB family nutrient-binding outer membrane lipoprotein n=1 Tax=Chitinophaga sp. sic0106 TaxID=2854785 RepID=UPI001C4754DD|nr:SusD/RagB family nutrient-binding outer membrane lipoprotein [Chitinophaga sp. sic0106]MBV7532993.1 SusD/RagB family nutrient-binding outer membrane lipoprotein [Chitinophaga sp. sic0106]